MFAAWDTDDSSDLQEPAGSPLFGKVHFRPVFTGHFFWSHSPAEPGTVLAHDLAPTSITSQR